MWEILGISPTSDIKAIKRAYAVKLKQTHPQDDPVAFQALRRAYEWALQEAKFISAEMVELDLKVVEPIQTQPASPQINPEVFSEPSEVEHSLGSKPVSINDIKIEILDPPPKVTIDTEAPIKETKPLFEELQQPTEPNLFQEAKLYASDLLKLLEETDEPNIKSTLAAFFEQDWFIHIDARTMLEDRLIQETHAQHVLPSYKVFAALMEYFDWGNETLIRNHYDDKVMDFIRWQFRHEREINAVKSAQGKGWKKERFLALLKNPPKPIVFRWHAFNPLIIEEARRKLKEWDEEFPDIYTYLNPGSVAWWRNRLAGNIGPLFKFSSYSILHFFGASFLASFISIIVSTVTGLIGQNSPGYQIFTWFLTLALFLWFSLHRDKASEKAPYDFSLPKSLITYSKQFVKTRHGRLIGLGFVAINSLLLLVTFDDGLWFIALLNLYFALSLWLEFRIFKWAFLSSITTFMLADFMHTDFINNKSSALHLLGLTVGGAGILKINKLGQSRQWGKSKHEFIFGLWLLFLLVLPILMYAQMPWLIENMSRVWAYLTMVSNQVWNFREY